MTLEEMLELLPDNDTGAIDAADLRSVVTGLYELAQGLAAKVNAVESYHDSISITGAWQYNGTPGVVPGGMQITTATGRLSDAAWIRFAKFDQDNRDFSTVLARASTLFIQQAQNAGTWGKVFVTGPGVDGGSYVELPISWALGSGSASTANWQRVVVVVTVPTTGAEVLDIG